MWGTAPQWVGFCSSLAFPARSAPVFLLLQIPAGGGGSERRTCEDGEAPLAVDRASGGAVLRCSVQLLHFCAHRAVGEKGMQVRMSLIVNSCDNYTVQPCS